MKIIKSFKSEKLLSCRKCRRLDNQFKRLRDIYPDYWNKPVPSAGSDDCALMIVGLAPGMHGANKSGIPFVGDSSGNLLTEVLKESKLKEKVKITNAVKCLPISNLPSSKEARNCSPFLKEEIDNHCLNPNPVLLSLGGVAHKAIIDTFDVKQAAYPFGHGSIHSIEGVTLVDSYHCSRYNTQTGRLTYRMFLEVVITAGKIAYP